MATTMSIVARGGNAAVLKLDTNKRYQLVRDFDEHLELRKSNRLELGKIARELKAIHVTQGQRERGQGWEAFLAERDLEVRTVDRWIDAYEVANGLRCKESVVDKMSRTNVDNKGDNLPKPIDEDKNGSNGQSDADYSDVSESSASSSWLETVNSKDSSTPEGRSTNLFKTAVNL